MTNLYDIVDGIRDRPEMYGLDRTFQSTVHFLLGIDVGSSAAALLGFSEWLVLKLHDGTNLGWPTLARRVLFPESPEMWSVVSDSARLSTNESRVALVDLVREFLADRSSRGVREIYLDYTRWLCRQELPGATDKA